MSQTVVAPAGAQAPVTSNESSGASTSRVQMKSALGGKPLALQLRALRPVQRKGGEDTGAVHEAAAAGIASGGGAMPHGDAIQKSFGAFDIGGVQAHTGAAATEANKAMGAQAYASGNHVAFGGTPDLHTAAHEAAHVVQQQAGVSLSGGVGQVGDKYEQHADKVADAVVKGDSAEGLLGEMTGGAPVQKRAVQRRSVQRVAAVQFDGGGVGSTGMGLPDDHQTSGPGWGAAQAEQDAELATFQGYLTNPTTHPAYASTFLPRVVGLFNIVGMDPAGAPDMASRAWCAAFQALNATDGATHAATGSNGRTNLTELKQRISGASQSVIEQFQSIASIVEPVLNQQFMRSNSFAFWSKPCALHLAMNGGADMALETSALGGLFNGLNLMGDGNIQLWAGLSTYYARAIVTKAKGKEVRVFVGPKAPPDNIYTRIEFPELEAAFNNGEISIINYAVAPKVEVVQKDPTTWEKKVTEGEHDPKENGGGIPGTYDKESGGAASRANMIGKAETEFAARQAAADAEVARKNTPAATPPGGGAGGV